MQMNDFTQNKPLPGYTYGGKTGEKLCILHNNAIWFLKFPQKLVTQQAKLSYSTAAVSEYLGSHIYKTIGVDTHETELGIYAGKPVTACKDFNKTNNQFYEFGGLLNTLTSPGAVYSANFGAGNKGHYVELAEIFSRMENSFSTAVQEQMKERFWQMFVVDAFINNPDRNTGNWGYFMNLTGGFVGLAPVYDNGSSFFPKAAEDNIQSDSFFHQVIYNSATPFCCEADKVDAIAAIRRLPGAFRNDDWNRRLEKAVVQVVPLLLNNINAFQDRIFDIPVEFQGVKIISEKRKAFYGHFLSKRLELVFEPALEKALRQA